MNLYACQVIHLMMLIIIHCIIIENKLVSILITDFSIIINKKKGVEMTKIVLACRYKS